MFNVVYTIPHGSDPNSVEVKSESFHYFNLYWINLEIPMCEVNLLFVILFLLLLFYSVFIICHSLCVIEFKSDTITQLCYLTNLLHIP